MSQGFYIAIAITIIAILLAIFVFSFIAYRKTPLPEGCEELKPSAEKCEGCQQQNCPFYAALSGRGEE